MARDGYSNQDIGSRLFIGPNTVDCHLPKAFSKARHHLTVSARARAALVCFRRFRSRPDLAQFEQFEAERFDLGDDSE